MQEHIHYLIVFCFQEEINEDIEIAGRALEEEVEELQSLQEENSQEEPKNVKLPIDMLLGNPALVSFPISCFRHEMKDFSSFDKMLVHLKLQTCFVLPGLISAIRSLKKNPLKLNEFEP